MASPSFSTWKYFFSAGARVWDEKQLACLVHLPSSGTGQHLFRMVRYNTRALAGSKYSLMSESSLKSEMHFVVQAPTTIWCSFGAACKLGPGC